MKYSRIFRISLLLLAAVVMVAAVAVTMNPAEFRRLPLEDNPYSPTDFRMENGYLTCTAGESVLGIDVSSYQQEIDWEAVKAAGVEYVFIRVGWRGTESGTLNEDKRAQEYYKGAKAAGLRIGAYFFSQAISMEEAAEEAAFALKVVKGWKLELPLVYDWEYAGETARTANMDRRTLTNCTRVFCRRVEDAGLAPMIYFNVSQAQHLLHLEELTEFPFWLAQYREGLDYPYRVYCWQYTGEGTVPGINVPVDLNLWFPKES